MTISAAFKPALALLFTINLDTVALFKELDCYEDVVLTEVYYFFVTTGLEPSERGLLETGAIEVTGLTVGLYLVSDDE